MIFKEFGDKNKPVIVLVHGGGLSWWSWRYQIDTLTKEYCVVAPIIDGHGEEWRTTFISIQDSASKIIKYIKENFDRRVFALCGLSIGAQIVVEVLAHEPGIAENAVIESALVCPMKMTVAMTAPMYALCYDMIKKRWFAKLQAKTLNVPEDLFEKYYEDSSRMTKETLINFTKSNGYYSVPSTLCSTSAKVLILVGEKELSVMKKSAAILHSSIKGSTLRVIEKARHGEISLIYPERYVDLLRSFFQAV